MRHGVVLVAIWQDGTPSVEKSSSATEQSKALHLKEKKQVKRRECLTRKVNAKMTREARVVLLIHIH